MKILWIFLALIAFIVVFVIIPGIAMVYVWQETSWSDTWKWIATGIISRPVVTPCHVAPSLGVMFNIGEDKRLFSIWTS